jgi:hypothetical protein
MATWGARSPQSPVGFMRLMQGGLKTALYFFSATREALRMLRIA